MTAESVPQRVQRPEKPALDLGTGRARRPQGLGQALADLVDVEPFVRVRPEEVREVGIPAPRLDPGIG